MSGIQGATMRSIRPYKSSEQYLYAMKEDLAEWLKELYDLEVDVGSFLEVLETGIWLCHHANNITQLAREFRQGYPSLVHKLQLPTCGTTCNELAQPGTFQARDNVSNFIQWCRKEMDIKEVLMFETEDLVLRKNEKNFVLCLLEVARRASRFGMSAPILIQMEEEIEEEIREDLNLPPEETPLPKPQRKPCSFKNLDQMVQCLISHCTCPVQFSMVKVSEGKYRVGDSSTLIFVRILRNHVMVRVGGGWDTLQHYLDKHDPCRCTSLSHKQALKLASPQRTHVQHEITARLTPRTDNPNRPQPALIVSRSQSPPPPVEWRPCVPLSLGPGRTVPASAPPSDGRTGGGSSWRCSSLQNSQDPPELRRAPSSRVRECSGTPSQRTPATEAKSRSQPNSTQDGQETRSFHQNGNMENGPCALRALPDPRRGRTAVAVQAATAPKEQTVRLAPSGIAAQRGGASQLPGSAQKDGRSSQPTRSPSPAKHFGPTVSRKAPVNSSKMPQERGVTEKGWWRDPLARQSFSPVKHVHQVHKEDSSAQILGEVGSTSYRPRTPCQRDQRELCLSNGGLHLAKDSASLPKEQVVQDGKMDPCKERSKTCNLRGFSDQPRLEMGQVDSRPKRKACQVLPGQEQVPRGKGAHGDPTVEKERVYTPLPIHPAEEQALYRSLEDEILSNIKELEADANHFPSTENQLRGSETGNATAAITCNGSGLLLTSLSSLQSGHKVVHGEGVPRSGVYVPERAPRWPSAGLHYDSVIRELSQTLHQECGGMTRSWPPLSSALVNGNQTEKKVPEREGSQEECDGIMPEGAAPSHPSQGGHIEINGNGGSAQETPSTAANSPESTTVLEDAKPPLSKPRRSLKKPERVPSIYKLKLRPKIRPRRDNRPEKRPSKIPTPLSYRHAQRGSAKAHNSKHRVQNCTMGLKQNKTGHTGGKEEVALSEYGTSSMQGWNSGEKMAAAEVKAEFMNDEEAWV